MAFVIWFYGWTITINQGFEDGGDLDYYRLLVRGWMKGQLHLDKEPAPELQKLADPYDPFQNAPYKLGDATYFRGRYYIYFGAAPALTLMLPYRLLTGSEMTTGAAIFVLCTVAFLAASVLWLALRRRYFPASSILMPPAGVLAIGFGTHLLALAQRPMFWEMAIVGGIAFSTLATALAYWAIHGGRPLLALSGAGLCVGLAVGSRPTCLLAAPLLLAPIYVAWRRERRKAASVAQASPATETTPAGASWRQMTVAAAIPLLACGAAIMAHNYARFENPLEFGQHYQLSGAHEGKLTHFSLRFIPHNFAVYFFQQLDWEPEFPFVAAPMRPIDDLPGYFGTEEVSGLAATFPFYWFLLALPLAWRRRERAEAAQFSAAMAVLAGYALPVMLIVLCYFSTTMRYEADFAVPVAVLALIGMLALERRAMMPRDREAAGGTNPASRPSRRRAVAALGGVASVVTVVVGVLVSFDYHGRPLLIWAQPTWIKFADAKHEFLGWLGCRLGQVEGPRVLKVRFAPRPSGTVETFWQASDPRAPERIVIEHMGDQLIRFGYARATTAVQWGRELRWERNHTHTVSVQLPSLYPPPGDGWWDRVRRHEQFRERTSGAVWFSGGRALEAVVDAWPAGIVPGGGMSGDFSGQVRRIGRRPYRRDEIDWGPAPSYVRRGGVLQLRVVFPPTVLAEGEPLLASGERPRASMIFAEPAAGGLNIVFQNSGGPKVASAVFTPDPRGHLLQIEMPTFRPEAYGWEGKGDVVVRLDGREILRTDQVAAPFLATTEQVGRNLFGNICGPFFRGWIFDVVWVHPPHH